jgi:cell division protein FtsB
MSLNSAEQCEAAVAQVATLTAENARLRGEVERLQGNVERQSASIRSLCMEMGDPLALKRPTIHAPVAASTIAALTTDLARVTGERDELKAEGDGMNDPGFIALLEAVERAWAGLDHDDVSPAVDKVLVATHGLLAALHAARQSGATVCVLSRESVEALREAVAGGATGYAARCLDLLAADVLKENTDG